MADEDLQFGNKNWCNDGWCNDIQDQGRCGAGWSFAAVAAVETTYAIKHSSLPSLSAQECIDCKPDGCTSNRTALSCIRRMQKHGISTSQAYPYTGIASTCKKDTPKSPVEIFNYTYIKNLTESVILDHLNKGPVIASLDASSYSFINYSGGILNSVSCKRGFNNHWVLIVGYGVDHYIIRNSWGKQWGLKTLISG